MLQGFNFHMAGVLNISSFLVLSSFTSLLRFPKLFSYFMQEKIIQGHFPASKQVNVVYSSSKGRVFQK